MPEDALLTALEEDARVQSERILSEAREAAADMKEAAEREAAEVRRKRTSEMDDSLRRKTASAVNAARMRAAGRALELRHEMAGQVLARVAESFAKLPRGEYAALVGRLYAELKQDWSADKEREKYAVLVNPADVELIKDREGEVRPDDSITSGVVFVSVDGRLRYENTIASRIKKAKDTLLPMIDKTLSGRD